MVHIGNDWDEILREEFNSDNYRKIREFLKKEYSSSTVYPDMHNLFNAFKATPYSKAKVVIIGQDPYHNEGQAHGLSFSVMRGIDIPPSLVNIFKELKSDLGCSIPSHGCLDYWAEQGVLLLNSSLSVRAHTAMSHSKCGWECFTDNVIKLINKKEVPVVFLLWGNFAKGKARFINPSKHYILESAHPSPLSAYRFFGCKHFSKTNELLVASGQEPIDWQIC